MTTFQSIIVSIVHAFSQFLPVGNDAHFFVFQEFLGWPSPEGALLAALSMGSTLALLIYFRHEWLGILGACLQVLFLQRKPHSLDERIPLLILVSTLPLVGLTFYTKEIFEQYEFNALFYVMTLILFTVPLIVADRRNRRNKHYYDWNFLDALLVGIAQCTSLIPGAGRQIGMLTGALLRNFDREAACKYVMMSLLPLVAYPAIQEFSGIDFAAKEASLNQGQAMTWISFWVSLIVTFFTGLIAIGGFMKNVPKKGFGGFITYRVVLAIGIGAGYFFIG